MKQAASFTSSNKSIDDGSTQADGLFDDGDDGPIVLIDSVLADDDGTTPPKKPNQKRKTPPTKAKQLPPPANIPSEMVPRFNGPVSSFPGDGKVSLSFNWLVNFKRLKQWCTQSLEKRSMECLFCSSKVVLSRMNDHVRKRCPKVYHEISGAMAAFVNELKKKAYYSKHNFICILGYCPFSDQALVLTLDGWVQNYSLGWFYKHLDSADWSVLRKAYGRNIKSKEWLEMLKLIDHQLWRKVHQKEERYCTLCGSENVVWHSSGIATPLKSANPPAGSFDCLVKAVVNNKNVPNLFPITLETRNYVKSVIHGTPNDLAKDKGESPDGNFGFILVDVIVSSATRCRRPRRW